MNKTTLAIILTLSTLLSSCATQSKRETGEQIGAVLGMVVGAVVGDKLGGDQSEFFSAAAGLIVGKIIGSEIGKTLDDVDRLKAELATKAALNEPSNTSVSWQSDKNAGVNGTVTTVTSGSCKEVTQVINVNGTETYQKSKMCKQPNGGWKLA